MIRNSAPHLSDRPTDIYRCYNASGELLYIGCTVNLTIRLKGHRSTSDWYPHVTRVTATRYPDRLAALTAEDAAIRAERPVHNAEPVDLLPLPEIERLPDVESLLIDSTEVAS